MSLTAIEDSVGGRTALQDKRFRKKYSLASDETTFDTKSLLYFVAGDPTVAEDLRKKGIFVVKDATKFLSI